MQKKYATTHFARVAELNRQALLAWLDAPPAAEPRALRRLRRTDAKLERATLADPDAARMWVRLGELNREIRKLKGAAR